MGEREREKIKPSCAILRGPTLKITFFCGHMCHQWSETKPLCSLLKWDIATSFYVLTSMYLIYLIWSPLSVLKNEHTEQNLPIKLNCWTITLLILIEYKVIYN